MNTVLLRTPFADEDVQQLKKEFPRYQFLLEKRTNSLTVEEWERIEIIYGDSLLPEELVLAPELRWIHSSSLDLRKICLPQIWARGNIILTCTQEENMVQVAEFVMANILAFNKDLFYWKEHSYSAQKKGKREAETLSQKLLLQVGLGGIGSEICRHAKLFNMRVWGVSKSRSFHPYCDKGLSIEKLEEALPHADVVVFTMIFQQTQLPPKPINLSLLKDGAILIIIGSLHQFDLEQLLESSKRLKGIVIDLSQEEDYPDVKSANNVIITSQMTSQPSAGSKQGYHIFHYNLRQYLANHFENMENRIFERT